MYCGCSGSTPSNRPLRAGAAGRHIGQSRPTEAEVRRLTRAAVVRQIAPGQPVTQDFSERRVTVVTDPATGRVVRASCG